MFLHKKGGVEKYSNLHVENFFVGGKTFTKTYTKNYANVRSEFWIPKMVNLIA